MESIGIKKVLLFGGKGNSGYLGDTWIYDFERNDWDSIKCLNFPSPRADFDMVQISENKVLLFGGRSDSTETNSDLWLFNIDSMNWKKIYALNPTEGRYGHRMARLNNSEILVFGGIRPRFQTTVYSNDTRIYNIDSNKWTSIKYSIDDDYHLQPRTGHLLADVGEDSVLLFGGGNPSNSDECYKTWLYRKGMGWDSLNPLNKNICLTGNGDMKIISDGLFLLFGGFSICDFTYDTWYEGTWIFNFYTKSWIELKLDVHPFGRLNHKMAIIDSNKIILYGGVYKGSQGTVSPYETWLFVLDSITTEIIEIPLFRKFQVKQINDNYLQVSGIPNGKIIHGLILFDINGNIRIKQNYENSNSFNEITLINVSDLETGIFLLVIKTDNDFYYEKVVFVK